MSRWFRHYAGMMRDDKLVSAAIRSKQTVERVVWIWGAILESAAEINDDGRFDVDPAEVAYFLRADISDVDAVIGALEVAGRLADGRVAKWSDRQFQSDSSAERQRRHRAKKRGGLPEGGEGDAEVTSPSRHSNAPDTESETEGSVAKATGAAAPADPVKEVFDLGVSILTASGQTEKQARSLIGKWRKAKSDGEVLTGLLDCRARAISNPIEWLEKRFGGTKYVSSSGYEYRGDLDAIQREAERRADWSTYYRVRDDRKGATGPPGQTIGEAAKRVAARAPQ